MTEQEITGLGPAFAGYLGRYCECFLPKRTMAHFDTYCRGLLSDLPRKSVEPIALAAGTAVRTLQEFLVTARWDHEQARDCLQQELAAALAAVPADSTGTVGVIDETSCPKWGAHTPGVPRQYLGGGGQIDNGIVTVHVGVAKGQFTRTKDAVFVTANTVPLTSHVSATVPKSHGERAIGVTASVPGSIRSSSPSKNSELRTPNRSPEGLTAMSATADCTIPADVAAPVSVSTLNSSAAGNPTGRTARMRLPRGQ